MNIIRMVVDFHPHNGQYSNMLRRHLEESIVAALADRPAVVLHGPRQAGKSTLAQRIAATRHPARYLTLDDPAVLSAAGHDPTGFIAGLAGDVVIDEVQRAPDLFLAIKADIDRRRQPGRFLLTGSANVLFLPRLAQALAGRIEALALGPLSQGEIDGVRERFVDGLFAARLPKLAVDRGTPLDERILRGGYPELVTGISPDRRDAWFRSYVMTILQRDVRDLQAVEDLVAPQRLLALLGARTSGIANYSEISRSLGLPQTTLKRYLALLEATSLVRPLPPWFSNRGRRLVKAPKLFVVDSGLAAHLAGINTERLAAEPPLLGPLLETFVVTEAWKQVEVSRLRPALHHFRTHSGEEVDLVMEAPDGRVVGVEVKATATVRAKDLRGLRALADQAGRHFHRGVILHRGEEVVPFGNELYSLPLSALWRLGVERG